LLKHGDTLNQADQALQLYVSAELVPRIQSSRYSSFVRSTPRLLLGTGPMVQGQAPNIKVPSSSYPTFSVSDISDVQDLLPFLSRTTTGSKEVYIIHLISEVEIERPGVPELEPYDSEDTTDKKRKGKGKGQKPRPTSTIASIPEPKRVRLQVGSEVILLFFVRTITNL
jgi:hypothetical protein